MNKVDYGPLELLIGTWKGELGSDRVPKTYGEKTNLFRETTVFEGVGQTENIDKEILRNVRYVTQIQRINDGKMIHDQVGYYSWIPASDKIMHSFTIPRGMAVVAGGDYTQNQGGYDLKISLTAKPDGEWPIVQSEFLKKNSRVTGFEMELTIKGDELSYMEHSYMHVFDKDFDHLDQNRLKKV